MQILGRFRNIGVLVHRPINGGFQCQFRARIRVGQGIDFGDRFVVGNCSAQISLVAKEVPTKRHVLVLFQPFLHNQIVQHAVRVDGVENCASRELLVRRRQVPVFAKSVR